MSMPYVSRICVCSDLKDFWRAVSAGLFWATVMSTIEPEVIDGGRRIEGNSI